MNFLVKLIHDMLILKVMLFSMLFCIAIQSHSQWSQSQFVIGTFWDPRFTSTTDTNNVNAAVDIARMVEAKNGGFNLCTGSGENADCGWHVTGGMQYGLFLASHAGLNYMVTDVAYSGCPAYDAPTAATVITNYSSSSLSLGQRNALYGYNIKDEPILTDETNLKSWLNYFKANDNTKLTYVNLMPRYYYPAGSAGDASYNTYLDIFLNDANPANRPDVVSYDNYPIFRGPPVTVRTDYFYNLDIVRTKAGTRPFWVYPLTTSDAAYADPTGTYIMFSDFCPMAYGAKGLIYFTYSIPTSGGPWYYGLIDAANNQTSIYNTVKTINQYINNLVGPMIMNSNSIGAYHQSTAPTGETISASQMLSSCTQFLNNATGLNNANLLAGVFQDKTNSSVYHGLVVNKSFSAAASSSVVLAGNYSPVIYLAPSVVGYSGSTMFTAVTATFSGGNTTFTLPGLVGGEGRLFTTSVPVISNTSVTNVCGSSSGSITITAAGGSGILQYSIDNGVTWQASNVFIGLTAGSYTVRVKDSNNFEFAYGSNPVIVTTASVPVTPIITQNGNVLNSNAANGNQWYNQGGLISNATNPSYTVTSNGNYYDIVTLSGCSSDTSNRINVVLNGIAFTGNSKEIKVYPNPVSNELIIEIKGNNKKVNFEIFNSTGQIVFNGNMLQKTMVPTKSFSPGIYLIKLENGNAFEFKKIIKE